MSVIEIINKKNSLQFQFEEHKEDFINCEQQLKTAVDNIDGDFVELLQLYNVENEDIKRMRQLVDNIADMCMIINYLLNGNPKSVEDIYRQIYVVMAKPIPIQLTPKDMEPFNFTFEEQEVLKNICLPYDFDELEQKYLFEEYMTDVYYLQKLIRLEKDEQKKKIINDILDKIAKPIPEDKVKEIHVFYDDGEMEKIFLDVAGVHQIVGKKTRLRFKDGKRVIGYAGSDFYDNDGNPTVALFENFDERKGFFNYNLYKIDDLVGADTLYTNDLISFKEIIPDDILEKFLTKWFIFQDVKEEDFKTIMDSLKTNELKMKALDYIIDKKDGTIADVINYCKELTEK